MRSSRTLVTLLVTVGLATLLVACSSDDDDSTDDTSTSTTQPEVTATLPTTPESDGDNPATSTAAPTPKPPDAETPAAGTCGEPTEPVVEVVVNPDIPSPRCVRVTTDQRLQIRNATDQPATVSLAHHSATIAPGETALFDQPFGDYLQPGVHRITMSTYGSSGAEVWLV